MMIIMIFTAKEYGASLIYNLRILYTARDLFLCIVAGIRLLVTMVSEVGYPRQKVTYEIMVYLQGIAYMAS